MGMTQAEQFKCDIPSPNAIKDGVIYCNTNATDTAEIWSAAGTWAGVALTIVMAYYAWKAWTTSRDQLHEMQDSIRVQVLIELRGIHAEFDSEITPDGSDSEQRQRILAIGERLRAIEEKFKMIWEYPTGAAGLSDFNTCIIGAIFAANDPVYRKHGSVQEYRDLRSRGNLIFRDFFKSKPRRIADLDGQLVECVTDAVQANPDVHKNLVDIYY